MKQGGHRVWWGFHSRTGDPLAADRPDADREIYTHPGDLIRLWRFIVLMMRGRNGTPTKSSIRKVQVVGGFLTL